MVLEALVTSHDTYESPNNVETLHKLVPQIECLRVDLSNRNAALGDLCTAKLSAVSELQGEVKVLRLQRPNAFGHRNASNCCGNLSITLTRQRTQLQ